MAKLQLPKEGAVDAASAFCRAELSRDPLRLVPKHVLDDVDLSIPFLIGDHQGPLEYANRFLRLRAYGKLSDISPRRLRPNSILALARDLEYFLTTYSDPAPGTLIRGEKILDHYRAHLRGTGRSVSTIERRYATAREFLGFMGALPSDTVAYFDAVEMRHKRSAPNLSGQRISLYTAPSRGAGYRRHPSLLFLLPPEQLLQFFAAFDDPTLRVVPKIIYATGARRAEVASMRAGPVARLRERYPGGPASLKVMGKGDKERSLEVEHGLVRGLKVFLTSKQRMERARLYAAKYGGSPYEDDAPLLINRFGDPLSAGAIGDSFRRASQRCGIQRSPHELRHEFAVNYLLLSYRQIAERIERAGFDAWLARLMVDRASLVLLRLSHLLGHSSVETTKNNYLRLLMASDPSLRDAWCAHLDQMGVGQL